MSSFIKNNRSNVSVFSFFSLLLLLLFRYVLPITSQNNTPNLKCITMAEPIFLNPNSYENIKTILVTLKTNLEIGKTREWSYVGCDGPPYVIASNLIEEEPEKYDWVAMSNGRGHLYMNQMKTLFNVAKDVLLEGLAKDILHFESPSSVQYFFNCGDTHKSYQSLEIFCYGTALEMVYEYSKCKILFLAFISFFRINNVMFFLEKAIIPLRKF